MAGNRKADNQAWFEHEVEESEFADSRLRKRLGKLLIQWWNGMGQTIPFACQDWASTKAAYRFLCNKRVNEHDILSGHFQASAERLRSTQGPVLIVQDTTAFSYQRERNELIGYTGKTSIRPARHGLQQPLTQCGILMHSSLAVTADGLPLGLAAVKFWTRSKFKGCTALKRHVNPTRVPIEQKESYRWRENMRQSTALLGEPARCVHIGDRESDIYELFCSAYDLCTHFLVRTCVDRLAGDGQRTVAHEMEQVQLKGLHRVKLRDRKVGPMTATLELRYQRMTVLPPIGKHKRYPALQLTVIHAQERNAPRGRARIEWKLITDMPVRSRAEAVEKLNWYAMRWKIETFHKILKSGCRAEESKLRTADRLANLIGMFCILSWRIFWLTMISRSVPQAPPEVAFTQTEIELLGRVVQDSPRSAQALPLLRNLLKRARLGGHLARASDPAPGNTVMWRGMRRLIDIQLGYELALTRYR
ncbi:MULTISPECIES: IS4 family transposase [Burkholderiaceae]|uniref:IS4 family transposase n=1 Tax=Burkholderiaceae TaxID=119060 RepID=UPI0009640FDB|nr:MULTISPECIES: IS4 family transposase [Burkholderiaceae]MCG1039382.1 IS4 family transposase [Mycetohabitans sp. B7]SIT64882.1 Transposase DNA-binding [Burkholderia sp. b14]